MERATKLLLIVTIFLVVLALDVEGGRRLQDKDKVSHPQNYFGSFGGTGGFIPTPSGPALEFGPSGFCSVPGIGCVRVPGNVVGSPP